MAGEFEGKVVLITGASGNLGSAAAKRFAAGGAKLVLVGRELDALKTMGDGLGVDCLPVSADLSSEEAVNAMVEQVEGHYGRIDALAHTVGGFASGKAVSEPGLDVLEKMWNLNVVPVYLVCGRVARHMLEHEISGAIISVVARSALKGSAKTGAYTASKAAALRILESLALEVRDKGIHVNAISPSTIDTPINRKDMPNADPSKWVTAEQIADAMAFLASDAAAGIYGTNLELYGRV
jgi:NAD(P)-dependent dehydrogenase (short-subunit alcohol dehydrogenase family)